MRTLSVALGVGCLVLLALAARSARSDGPEKDMATASVSSNVPAIDRRSPAKVETATFAVG